MTRRTRIATLSIADLHAEIRRRERGAKSLLRRRQTLLKKIASLDAQIMAAGGRPGKSAGPRPSNEMSLVEALRQALNGKTMSVTDAAEAVQKAGYRTSAANFRTMVNVALLNKRNKFKRVERGMYTAG
ncbi:MAG: hypothetical protein AMXMBFR58_24520 [Phycisphaerae bacterium]